MLSVFSTLSAKHAEPGDGRPKAVLQQVTGTTLVCITNANKYDGSLGTEWLKTLRGLPAGQLSPFVLHVALALGRQQRLEAPMVAAARRLLAAAAEAAAERPPAWLPPTLAASGGAAAVPDAMEVRLCSIACFTSLGRFWF